MKTLRRRVSLMAPLMDAMIVTLTATCRSEVMTTVEELMAAFVATAEVVLHRGRW